MHLLYTSIIQLVKKLLVMNFFIPHVASSFTTCIMVVIRICYKLDFSSSTFLDLPN